jgi:hypothetical protein
MSTPTAADWPTVVQAIAKAIQSTNTNKKK